MSQSDHDIRRLLREIRVPAAPEARQDAARRRALGAFRESRIERMKSPEGHAPPRHPNMLRWAVAMAGCVVVASLFVLWSRPSLDDGRASGAEEQMLLSEMEVLFRYELAGLVVGPGGEVDVRLSDRAIPRPADQQVAFRTTVAGGHATVITYSGTPIRLKSGQTMTPLLSGCGEVVVIGDDGSVIEGWRVRG